MPRPLPRLIPALGLLAAGTSPALAHHVMDGMMPVTAWQGFASGVAHPVIGPDHFTFIALAALLFSMTRAPMPLAATLVVTGLAGTLLRVGPLSVPFAETLVAATLLVAGAVIAYRAVVSSGEVAPFVALPVALAGLFHGFAWGESVVGSDIGVLGSYLAGLAVVQFAVLAGIAAAFRSFANTMPQARVPVLASAGVLGMMAGAGFVLAG